MSTQVTRQTGITRANKNKAIRQEALREQLSAGKHIQHVLEIAQKLGDLRINLSQSHIVRLNMKANIKLALIKKYLPDLKQTEVTIIKEEAPIDIAEVDKQLAKLYAINSSPAA